MSKPDDISQGAWDDAGTALMQANIKAHMLGEPTDPLECIARAIMDAIDEERQRCLDICAAEREWCSGIEEVQLLIASGSPPRVIPGWNAPSEDD